MLYVTWQRLCERSGEMLARKKNFIQTLPNRLKLGSSHNCQPTCIGVFLAW